MKFYKSKKNLNSKLIQGWNKVQFIKTEKKCLNHTPFDNHLYNLINISSFIIIKNISKNFQPPMSIQSTKNFQSLYNEGTSNPKQNKRQLRNEKCQVQLIQNSMTQCRYIQNNIPTPNTRDKIEEKPQIQGFVSRKISTKLNQEIPINPTNGPQKDIAEVNNLQNPSNNTEITTSNNERIPMNATTQFLKKEKEQKKIYLNQNRQENEDNLSSRHQAAIQGNSIVQSLLDQKKNISNLEHSLNLDKKVRSQQYQNSYQQKQALTYKGQYRPNRIKLGKTFRKCKLLDLYSHQVTNNSIYYYQEVYPQINQSQNSFSEHTLEQLKKIKGIMVNVDTYPKGKDRQNQKKYYNTLQSSRISQIIRKIKMYMMAGYIIFLQEVNSKLFRSQLLKLIKSFNSLGLETYFYPRNLEDKEELVTTMILTKLKGIKFGQLKFTIQNLKDQKQVSLSEQAFFEFSAIVNGKSQTFCFFSCHLKSNRGKNDSKEFRQIRQKQIDNISRFGKKYNRFFCIGDTNIGSSKLFKCQNEFVAERFCDAVDYKLCQQRGTFLFFNKNGQPIDERLDRILLDKESFSTTSIKIKYLDWLLEQFEHRKFKRSKLVQKIDGFFKYKTLVDHSPMEFQITFLI